MHMKSLHLQGVWGSQTLYNSDNMMILLQIYNKKEPNKNPAAMATASSLGEKDKSIIIAPDTYYPIGRERNAICGKKDN